MPTIERDGYSERLDSLPESLRLAYLTDALVRAHLSEYARGVGTLEEALCSLVAALTEDRQRLIKDNTDLYLRLPFKVTP